MKAEEDRDDLDAAMKLGRASAPLPQCAEKSRDARGGRGATPKAVTERARQRDHPTKSKMAERDVHPRWLHRSGSLRQNPMGKVPQAARGASAPDASQLIVEHESSCAAAGDDRDTTIVPPRVTGMGEDLWANGSIEFTFNPEALGGYPTHAGVAWTDGAPGCDASLEAYDSDGALIGTSVARAVGDGDNNGGTAEDRFLGVVNAGGVSRIVVRDSGGGVEADHLQYGR
jgi:hypothetical protein